MPEEISTTVIEQTDSGENHYVLRGIEEKLGGIMTLLQAAHESSEELRIQAQEVLEAHEQSAQEYMGQLTGEPDFYPFVEMPPGTLVRDLPDGGRLFTLADGVFVRTHPDGTIFAIMHDGLASVLEPAQGGIVTLPDGRELVMVHEALIATHEVAGIAGLPLDIDPVQVASGRFSVELPGEILLEVLHQDRLAMVINPTGTVVVLGISRIEGIGEEVRARIVAGGARGFISMESNHQGVIEADGTIHAALSNGLDLVIRFPEMADDPSSVQPDESETICEERG